MTHLGQLFGLRKDFSVFHRVCATVLSVRTCPELLCFVSQLNTNLGPTANPPTTRAVTCRGVPWAKECSDVRVFSFSDEDGLRECLSQDRWGRARTLPTHLPSPNENGRQPLPYERSITHAGDHERESLWEVVGSPGIPFTDVYCYSTASGLRRGGRRRRRCADSGWQDGPPSRPRGRTQRPVNDLSNGAKPARGLPECAAAGVDSTSVQQPLAAGGAHGGLHCTRTTLAEACCINKLICVQHGAPVGVQLAKQGVVDVLAAEVTESCERVPGALLFMGLLEGGAHTIINMP